MSYKARYSRTPFRNPAGRGEDGHADLNANTIRRLYAAALCHRRSLLLPVPLEGTIAIGTKQKFGVGAAYR
jgi:hypothetical protein